MGAVEGVAAIGCAHTATETVTKLLEAGRSLMSAPVGIAVLVDENGSPDALVHSGISVADLARLPHLPSPVGLVSVVLGGVDLRVDDIGADPRAAGLLDALGMCRLLAAPMWGDGRVLGAVFFARRGGDAAFGAADETVLGSITRLAADRVIVTRPEAAASYPGVHRAAPTARPVTPDGALGRFAVVDPAGPWVPPERHIVHLQPIAELATGRLVGVEALSRFPDVNGTSRSPEVVFAEADRCGRLIELEHRGLCRALATLEKLPTSCYLSVNLSPRAMLAPAVFAELSSALRRHPGRLVVELTEHAEVPYYEALVKTLDGLRQWGLRLAVDDVGSGFASLRHVMMLHPDVLKLDMGFVRDIDTDSYRRAVAKSMVTFASEVGADFIAEGIETAAERDALQSIGASLGQGYLLGRPAPVQHLVHAT